MSNVKDTARYAGFWVRLVASIIDLVVTGVILTPLWVWYFRGLFGPESGLYVLGYGTYVVFPICLVVPFLYCTAFWTWRGQTPGKIAMRISTALHIQDKGIKVPTLMPPVFHRMISKVDQSMKKP